MVGIRTSIGSKQARCGALVRQQNYPQTKELLTQFRRKRAAQLAVAEEKIERVLEELIDHKEAVRIQTQAMGHLADTLTIHGQWLAKIHTSVTQEPEGDVLGDLLRGLIAADRVHTAKLDGAHFGR